MRQIGTLPTAEEAKRFVGYLFTVGIETKGEQDGDAWAIWAFDEDRLNEVREELETFQQNPQAEKYQNLDQQVAKIISQRAKEVKAASRQQVSVRKRWERPAWQQSPVTTSLIVISVVVAITGSSFKSFWTLCDKREPVVNLLLIEPVQDAAQDGYIMWTKGLPKIQQGEVWRLATPMFLHFSLLHIAFNMMWLRDLGQIIEFQRGSLRFLLMVLVTAVLSNLAQYFWSGHPLFGGMSGVVYGLFGYIWMKSKYDPAAGLYMPPNIVFWMIGFFFISMTGAIGNIANMAHGAGLGIGMIFGLIRPAIRFLSQK